MNLPIDNKELKNIIKLLENSGEKYKFLYTKLWSYNINKLIGKKNK